MNILPNSNIGGIQAKTLAALLAASVPALNLYLTATDGLPSSQTAVPAAVADCGLIDSVSGPSWRSSLSAPGLQTLNAISTATAPTADFPNAQVESNKRNDKPFRDVYISGFDMPKSYIENLAVFWSDMEIELQHYSNRLGLNNDQVKSVGLYAASKVAELNADQVLLELSPDKNLKFTLRFSEERMLMINKPLMAVEGFPVNDVIFSVFEGDELVSADSNDFDDFIRGFKEYIDS